MVKVRGNCTELRWTTFGSYCQLAGTAIVVEVERLLASLEKRCNLTVKQPSNHVTKPHASFRS